MKRRPTLCTVARDLYAAGIHWYDTPKIYQHPKEGKCWKYADAWKADHVDPAALAPILAKHAPWLTTGRSVSQYAPEQSRPVILLLTAKAINTNTNTKTS